MNRSWYEVKNQTADSAELFLYDEIGGWGVTAADFVRDLRALAGKAITLRVHSPGGSVLDGHAIYNALLRHAGGVTVQIDGLAASMAGVIAMSGKPVRMAENAFLMIHNPAGGVFGGADEMRKQADLIDKMRDGLVNVFAQKTGKSASEIEKVMDAETWFTAQEAKDFGLIDEITDRLDIAAKFDALTNFKNLPSALVDTSARAMDIATLTSERDAARVQAQTNFASFTEQAALVTNLTAERDDLSAKFAKVSTEFSALAESNTQLTASLAEAQKLSAERVNAEAARVLASAGHPPVALGSGTSHTTNTMTRAEFDALDGEKRRAFLYAGGKLH